MADTTILQSTDTIDPLSDKIERSDYVQKLPLDAKRRYAVKLLYNYGRNLLPDPYLLKSGWKDDPTLWPELEYYDIYNYLIETSGSYTKESLKAYKSLEAYRFVVSVHVQIVEYHEIGADVPFCAVRAKVTPSQRISEKPHQPWAFIDKLSGSVFWAHCTCFAGLEEVCSHVATLLFKIDIAIRLGISSTCSTSEVCKWNQAFRKELKIETITDIQTLMNGKRKKLVTSSIPSCRDKLPDKEHLLALKAVWPGAVFFATIPRLDEEETDTASETGEYQKHVQPLRDLFRENSSECLSQDDILEVWRNVKVTERQVKDLELATRGQSVCPTWYEQRKGRITASRAHDILVRKKTTRPDNFVRLITGSKCYNLSEKKAVKWGISNEEKARSEYFLKDKSHHQHLNVRTAGLMVDNKKPFLAVSSDGIVTCNCCEKRLVEIKCPFKHKDKKIQQIKDKDFCLDSTLKLKPSHRYYTQVQLQMYVYNVKRCDLFIYTNKDSIIVDVKKDDEFCSNLVDKCENFFLSYVLPELLTHNLENGVIVSTKTLVNSVDDEPYNGGDVWCFCQEPEYGKMIECTNEDCPTKWFHYECVNIRRCPRGKWVCPECSDV